MKIRRNKGQTHTINMEYHYLMNMRRIRSLFSVIRICEYISSEKENKELGLFLYYSSHTFSTNHCDNRLTNALEKQQNA